MEKSSYGVVTQEFIVDLIQRIKFILSHSEKWNMKKLYPKDYNEGNALILILRNEKKIEKEVFQRTNDFIVDYCNAYEENELHTTDLKLYQELMNYTTIYLYDLGYKNEYIIYYLVN